jgi:CRISPR-associated protein Csh1
VADLIKIFKEVGEVYADEALQTYNEIERKKIDAVAFYDVANNQLDIVDIDTVKSRLYLRVTSSNGGNLYPFFFYAADKLEDALKKAFKNMKRYLTQERIEELESIEKKVDAEAIKKALEPYGKYKNLYLAIAYEEKTLYERFKEVAQQYVHDVCTADYVRKGDSYFRAETETGYDAGLNFCSVNEMPAPLQKRVKYRLLSLAKDEACLVKQGFIKIFESQMFRFSLFGLSYYLLPTIFIEQKRPFFDKLESLASQNGDMVKVEKRLGRLVASLQEESTLYEKVLLSFLLAHKQNNAIDLYQLIEDVSPSRITKAFLVMDKMEIDQRASRFVKNKELKEFASYLFIRDYIEDGLLLAKLMLGSEVIRHRHVVIGWIAKQIRYGDNRKDGVAKALASEVLAFCDVSTFEKAQRFLNMLKRMDAVRFDVEHYVYKEIEMNEERFDVVAQRKFDEVELLRQKPRAREFYVLGALARFVMDWQYKKDSDSFKKYLDGIGAVNMQNKDRVFRKIYDISRKYDMHGEDYDGLMKLYVEIRESLNKENKLSIDEAGIAFVMGAVDFRTYKQNKKERNDDK